MALTPVDQTEIATIVTTLEMRERPRPRPLPASPLSLAAWAPPDPAKYRTLFARVGAPWLWFSRLVMDEASLTAIIHDPAVSVFAVVDRMGIEVGLLELDHRQPGACEIGYFGLVPELAGRGHGRWLMAQAMMRAWTPGVERVWVHTCTLDHPSALNFYRKQGFTAVSRAVETFPDPRRLGLLPEDAAPQIPQLAPND
ncbi:GNAT family N-acetyltransferase [Sphingomonas sp. CFBP8993]|uniref:GNAT family N-acetyltransferase n=1 Tax=Sphingomonas sp. CFBP8993 TaxID=3096526 RepID=UPI002A6A92DA|nr:GNAT family N-acetyltransferase [Sphingomonas sp. CFBP8993]MDY0958207.1 GNAT family N-acetyltransferase [Sphingomonas sp. CFBP8993]